MVSPGWKPGQPVALFARIDDAARQRLAIETREDEEHPALSGLLIANDLEGIARTELEEKAMVIARRHYILDPAETPERRERLGTFLLGAAGVLSPIALVVWLVKRRRRDYD